MIHPATNKYKTYFYLKMLYGYTINYDYVKFDAAFVK